MSYWKDNKSNLGLHGFQAKITIKHLYYKKKEPCYFWYNEITEIEHVPQNGGEK